MSNNIMLASSIVQLIATPNNCNKYMGEQFLFIYSHNIIYRDIFKKTNAGDNYLRLIHTDPETMYKALATHHHDEIKSFLISLIPFTSPSILPNLTNTIKHMT